MKTIKSIISERNEIFVCGLIGSGKDTVVKTLQTDGYHKLRLAGTIKHYLCDVLGVSADKLETLKRENSEIRELHHEVSSLMDDFAETIHGNFMDKTNSIVSINRLESILERSTIDFENKIDKFIISDVRAFNEIEKMFLHDTSEVLGIFLLRNSQDGEYVNNNHWTNKLDYDNDKLIDLLNEYREDVIIIDNTGNDTDTMKIAKEFVGDNIFTIDLPANEITGEVLVDFVNDLGDGPWNMRK